MAQRTFKANLTNSKFPHVFNELGSTVVLQDGFEQNVTAPQPFEGAESEQSNNVCQAYYMENVLPQVRGYSSIKFSQMLDEIPGLKREALNGVFGLRGSKDSVAILATTPTVQYVFSPEKGTWLELDLGVTLPAVPTTAYVKGDTYIFYDGLGLYHFNFFESALEPVEMKGLNPAGIRGICAAGAVMVAWTDSAIHVSSQLDPTDFTPDPSTGAHVTNVVPVKGEIVVCLPMGDSFVIYTATNAVAAQPTNNAVFPFSYSEIPGAKGIAIRDHVAYDTTRNMHITWTASGFQQVQLNGAEYTWPELGDGIIRGKMTIYDPTYLAPMIRQFPKLDVKLSFVSNRWVAVSIKDPVERYYYRAHIYDITLNRWGVLAAEHVHLFEFFLPNLSSIITYNQLAAQYEQYQDLAGLTYADFGETVSITAPEPGKNFGLIAPNGSVWRSAPYDSDLGHESTGLRAARPIILLGRFKLFRTRGTSLQRIQVDRLEPETTLRAYGHSYTGDIVTFRTHFVESKHHRGLFTGRCAADSFTLELSGHFNLHDLVMSAADAGSRNQRRPGDIVFCVFDDDCPVYDGDKKVISVDPQFQGDIDRAAWGSKYWLQRLYDSLATLVESQYTEESWARYWTEHLYAESVLANPCVAQEVIDGAYDRLHAGWKQLEKVPTIGCVEPFETYDNARGDWIGPQEVVSETGVSEEGDRLFWGARTRFLELEQEIIAKMQNPDADEDSAGISQIGPIVYAFDLEIENTEEVSGEFILELGQFIVYDEDYTHWEEFIKIKISSEPDSDSITPEGNWLDLHELIPSGYLWEDGKLQGLLQVAVLPAGSQIEGTTFEHSHDYLTPQLVFVFNGQPLGRIILKGKQDI